MSDKPDATGGGRDQRELVARLRAVIEAKDSENAMLRAELQAQLERYRRLELRVAELERRLGSDSTTSGTPPSKDPIGPRERAHPGSISYGPGINTAAVLLTSYGNVPAERAANLIGMLLGVPVSAGFVDGASERLSSRLDGAGFDKAMQAALGAEPVLAADETPVNLIDPHAGLAGQDAGAPHVLVVRTPHRGLTWLRALGSRRAAAIAAVLSFFTGFLISDGYSAYQQLLPQLAGVQQCCQHIIRRCRAVTRLGPGSLQSWATDIIDALRDAHQAVDAALARGDPTLDAELLAKLRGRYDEAVAFGITHNRHRDWHDGNHPGYALGCWLRDYQEQVWLFTREFALDWTNNCSGQAIKAAKRHQAVSGYWHTQQTLARWCRIRSYLDSAASHGLTALDATTRALAGEPWLPAPAN